jgi:hypothetical protein
MPLRDTPPVSKNQPAHSIDFPELGMGITLPPDWNILKQPGVVLAGPGLTADNSMERTWLHLSSNADVPQTLAELTQVMTDGMRTVGHIKQLTTTRIIVGEIEGIAIWWTQPNQSEHWLSVHVPAHGIVHEIVFHPLLLSPDGTQLKSAGQAILDSIRFTPTSISSSTSQATIAKIPFGLNIEEHALKDARMYWVYDHPHEPPDSDPGPAMLDLGDDLGDIYKDVMPALRAWESGVDEYLPEVLFTCYETLFFVHWGRHAVSALLALHPSGLVSE